MVIEIVSYKYYNKGITTGYNGNVQSHDKEESKLNSTINANTYILQNNKKVSSIKITSQLLKTNKILTKVLLLGSIK